MCLPLAADLFWGASCWEGFAAGIAVSALPGFLLYRFSGAGKGIYRREGFVLVGFVWIIFSLSGMLPFVFSGPHLSVADAFFETMSGFTTTGATVIQGLESLPRSILLWRALTQWIGGLGIIIFMLAVLPFLNENGGSSMYNAEITGMIRDRIHPRVHRTASTLWIIYVIATAAEILLLWAGPMDFFDAVCHSFTTVSTGGFSTRDASIAAWHSDYIAGVVTVFMFFGGVNFVLLRTLFSRGWRKALDNDVLRAYALIVALSAAAVLCVLLMRGEVRTLSDALLLPLFHVVSAITTTGFAYADFTVWGPFCLIVTLSLMLCGACAGSTTGAIKVDRVLALYRNMRNELHSALYPRRICAVRVGGNVVASSELSRLMAFVTMYMLSVGIGALVTSAFGISLTDSLFVSVTCLGNNGLGYGLTGVAGGFGLLPDAVKWVMSFLMLAGRLELFSIVMMAFTVFSRK